MSATVTVTTRDHGALVVYAATDFAGNKRMVPVNGAPLMQWRADKTLVPPWLLPEGFESHETWFDAMIALREGGAS